jgi:exonuclease III
MDSVNKLCTFNCKSLKRSMEGVRSLCKSADILALQETWLLPHDLPLLNTVDEEFGATGTSAVDTTAGILTGRPFGGVAILWRKGVFPCVSVLDCNNCRLSAIKVSMIQKSLIVLCVYMPVNTMDNLPEFTECFSAINAIVEDNIDCESVYILGDFNAHPQELFCNEMLSF